MIFSILQCCQKEEEGKGRKEAICLPLLLQHACGASGRVCSFINSDVVLMTTGSALPVHSNYSILFIIISVSSCLLQTLCLLPVMMCSMIFKNKEKEQGTGRGVR